MHAQRTVPFSICLILIIDIILLKIILIMGLLWTSLMINKIKPTIFAWQFALKRGPIGKDRLDTTEKVVISCAWSKIHKCIIRPFEDVSFIGPMRCKSCFNPSFKDCSFQTRIPISNDLGVNQSLGSIV